MKSQPFVNHEVLSKPNPGTATLDFLASRMVRNTRRLFVSCPVRGTLLRQHELRTGALLLSSSRPHSELTVSCVTQGIGQSSAPSVGSIDFTPKGLCFLLCGRDEDAAIRLLLWKGCVSSSLKRWTSPTPPTWQVRESL